jgi:hypothetical protein
MVERQDLERLHQVAAEMIVNWSMLTDGLTDVQARPLMAWAIDQGEAIVRHLIAQPTLVTLPAGELGDILADRLLPLQRLMWTVGEFVAGNRHLSRGEIAQELEYILEVARQLPGSRHPWTPTTDATLERVCTRLAGLENPERLQAVLALLGGWPEDAAYVSQRAMLGGEHDDGTDTE